MKEEIKEAMIESILKSLDAIATTSREELTKEFAAKVAKRTRDMLADINAWKTSEEKAYGNDCRTGNCS